MMEKYELKLFRELIDVLKNISKKIENLDGISESIEGVYNSINELNITLSCVTDSINNQKESE